MIKQTHSTKKLVDKHWTCVRLEEEEVEAPRCHQHSDILDPFASELKSTKSFSVRNSSQVYCHDLQAPHHRLYQ